MANTLNWGYYNSKSKAQAAINAIQPGNTLFAFYDDNQNGETKSGLLVGEFSTTFGSTLKTTEHEEYSHIVLKGLEKGDSGEIVLVYSVDQTEYKVTSPDMDIFNYAEKESNVTDDKKSIILNFFAKHSETLKHKVASIELEKGDILTAEELAVLGLDSSDIVLRDALNKTLEDYVTKDDMKDYPPGRRTASEIKRETTTHDGVPTQTTQVTLLNSAGETINGYEKQEVKVDSTAVGIEQTTETDDSGLQTHTVKLTNPSGDSLGEVQIKTQDPEKTVKPDDIKDVVRREEYNDLADSVADNNNKPTTEEVKKLIDAHTSSGETFSFAEKEEVFGTKNPDLVIPQSKVQGLEQRLNEIEERTPVTNSNIVEKVKDIVLNQIPSRDLDEVTGTLYMREDDKWVSVDETLDVRYTKNQEYFECRYRRHDGWSYPKHVRLRLDYWVDRGGKQHGESSVYAGDKDVASDWFGGWFLNHNEFKGNDKMTAKVRMSLLSGDYDPDPQNNGYKQPAPVKEYEFECQRHRKEITEMVLDGTVEVKKKYRWEVKFVISGQSLTEDIDFDENKGKTL